MSKVLFVDTQTEFDYYLFMYYVSFNVKHYFHLLCYNKKEILARI